MIYGLGAMFLGAWMWIRYPVWNAGRGVQDRISATVAFLCGVVIVTGYLVGA